MVAEMTPLAPHPPLRHFYREPGEREDFVRDLFDGTAPWYDWAIAFLSFGSGNWYRRQILTRAGLKNGDRVLDITVRRGVRVEGTVRDARGVPLEGATVNLNDAAGVAGAGETDLRGHYGFAVPPGHYTVDAFAPFRGERLSVVGHDLDVSGFTVYDVTLPDASP